VSADSQIFVSGASVESLVSAVTTLLPDAQIRPENRGRGTSFSAPRVLGDVRSHDYDTDGDLNFADYPVVIEFQGIRNRPDSAATQQEFGQGLFDLLSSRGIDLLWVDNLQTRVGEHHPPSNSTVPPSAPTAPGSDHHHL